jgi:hypothetical protein
MTSVGAAGGFSGLENTTFNDNVDVSTGDPDELKF